MTQTEGVARTALAGTVVHQVVVVGTRTDILPRNGCARLHRVHWRTVKLHIDVTGSIGSRTRRVRLVNYLGLYAPVEVRKCIRRWSKATPGLSYLHAVFGHSRTNSVHLVLVGIGPRTLLFEGEVRPQTHRIRRRLGTREEGLGVDIVGSGTRTASLIWSNEIA